MDFAALFRGLYERAPIGEDEKVLAQAEQRLGLRLPPPLHGAKQF